MTKNNYILGHNRDESPKRIKAEKPKLITRKNKSVTAPIDGSKKGTWIYSNDNETVLLFNGAFKKHKHVPPYQRSRGIIVLESLEFERHYDFISSVELNLVEPFTQIFIDNRSREILELIWDGSKKTVTPINWAPFIRSSVTLYSAEIHQKKMNQFEHWLSNHHPKEVLNFMQNDSFEVPIMLNHPKVMTLSTTIVNYINGRSTMNYYEYH